MPHADALALDAWEETCFEEAIQRFDRLVQSRTPLDRRTLDQLELCLVQLDRYQAHLRRRQLHQGLALNHLKRSEPALMTTVILKDEPGIVGKNGVPVRWDQVTGMEMLMARPGPNHPLDADVMIRRFLAAKETRLIFLRRCIHEEAGEVARFVPTSAEPKEQWAERVRALCIEVEVLEIYFDLVELVRKHVRARAARTRMVAVLPQGTESLGL